MASLDNAHLHPLSFPLTHLDRLSSLELALVQFHLDDDKPEHSSTVLAARNAWRERRRAAVEAGELLQGQRPPRVARRVRPAQKSVPPAPAAAQQAAYPPVPHKLLPLVENLRRAENAGHSGREPGPLSSNVGSGLKSRYPDAYTRDPKIKTFKDMMAAALSLGIVEAGRGEKAGRDWVRLTPPYRTTNHPAAPTPPPPPARSPSPPPSLPSLSLPTPLTPSLFHLANLAFDSHLEYLDSLSTSQLLLLQFRDDVEAAGTDPHLWTAIERVFWRRRAAAIANGERWSTQLPAGHPLTEALNESIPASVAIVLHVVQVEELPDDRAKTVLALADLLPPHLLFVAATVSAPTFTSDTRTAHVAFRTAVLANSAQAFFAGLQLGRGGTGLPARILPAETVSHWRWRDVHPDERIGLWNHYELLPAAKRSLPLDLAEDRSPDKKPRLNADVPVRTRGDAVTFPQKVHPDDFVPASCFSSMFPITLLYKKMPAHLNTAHVRDDAFIYRFQAAGYLVKTDRMYLCFESVSDRHDFGEWAKQQAASYWKQNGLSIRALAPGMVVQYGWRFRDFSPDWRRRNRYVFDQTDSAPSVGEIGFGPSFPIAPYELGLFNFEYKQQGRVGPPNSFLPPQRMPSQSSERAASVSLASRLNAVDAARSPAPSEPASYVSRAPTPAHANGAFGDTDEAEDVKPSAEVLRRAEELANAVRTQSTSLPVAPSPSPQGDQPRPSSTANGDHAVAAAVDANAPRIATSEAAPAPSISSMSVCPAEQPASANRRRRLTAMELTDFERDLDAFTASVADAVMGSASPPAADRPKATPLDGNASPSFATSSSEAEARAAEALSSVEQPQTLIARAGGSLPGEYQPLTPVSLTAPSSAPASTDHPDGDSFRAANEVDTLMEDAPATVPSSMNAAEPPPLTAPKNAPVIPGLPARPSFVDPPPFDYRM